VGIPEVGNRRECSKIASSENSLGIPKTGEDFPFYRGDCTYRGVVAFTGSISFIAKPVKTSSLRASEI